MSGTVIFLAIGFLLIALLALLLRRSKSASGDDYRPSESASSLPCQQFEERSRELVDRIFGPEDWDFALRCASKDVRRLFLIERKQIALCWLSQIRSQAKAALHFHVARARESETLEPMLELRLAFDYVAIRVKCGWIAAILFMQGPVALRRMVEQAGNLSDQLRGLVEVASKTDPYRGKTD
jgi:hypothetical protein